MYILTMAHSLHNVFEGLKALGIATKSEDLRRTIDHIANSSPPMELKDVVKKLSDYVLKFEDAHLFLKYLSNVILMLVSTKIPLKTIFSNVPNDAEKSKHLEYSIAFSLLSEHPDILQYALKYFDLNSVPPFEVFIHHEESYNVAPKKRRLQNSRQKITDYLIAKCCYNLLKKLPNEFSLKWDWTKFVTNFSQHKNPEIRRMVKECMAILTNMTERQSKLLAQNLSITDADILNMLPLKTEAYETQGYEENVDFSLHNVLNIDGVMLTIYNMDNVQSGHLVPVKSTVSNLRSIALAVASGKAINLMGPVGSGKTSLVEHLASVTGRKGVAFKKVQLGDQTDSRLLLGSQHCTDIPGEFVWRPGVLTEAVQNGHWLLLEDIDCAALDVASTLSSLLERNTLCVPGYRDALPVTPGFQLFVTQRTMVTNYGFQKKLSNSSTLLQKHLTQINVEPLSRSELSEIIQTQFPVLTSICPKMIEVFMMFSVGSHDTSLNTTETVVEGNSNLNIIRGSRLISTRDLLKWCARAVVGYNVSSPESALKVLQDALDIFTCSVASPDDRLELAKKLGTSLGIVETKTEFYCKHYKPNVSLTPAALEVGRAKVPRTETSLESLDLERKQTVFSFTRQSACLLERIACCVTSNEPVLLVGETGTGKTSTVQYLAKQTAHKLVVINMNQQSDSADLLGGYKPVDLKHVIQPVKNEFEALFCSFFNVDKNKKFLNHVQTCYETESWTALLTLMKASHKSAVSRLATEKKEDRLLKWQAFGHKLDKLELQVKSASRLTFAFIEGSLVKAMQEGHWVLLDEINLASAEILECLAGLLEDKDETIDLLEKGDKVPIKRHPEFTLFACMNPATDVGKKDLPVGLRNRFTEFFIDELTERNDLMLLVGDYLYHMNLGAPMLDDICKFYITIRKEAKINLVDGSGNTPHYSLRTLCRALTSAAKAKCGTVSRSLYEAFCLAFLTQLDRSSHPKVEAMIAKAVIGKKSTKSVLNQLIPEPQVRGQNFLLFEGHWIPQGKLEIDIPEGYILTDTVRKNLRDIARIISLGKLPILLQGDTSVGKTSLITYIARASGNFCVRINNHEHTDLQEYIGSYASDTNGKLVFKEGVLVEAMRKGYWIILDELNLAPSDVLEALNRVLDDNRELFIPETQQVVKADPNFMLFATQNPPGLYGGRKMLSRAFRNRFVELHFDEIPRKELETILHQRCHVPPTYSKKMIAVMAELQVRRRGSAAVQGKDGFITLRDLFRWGHRYRYATKELLTEDKFYDWDQHIADEGYLILAGKVRQTDERVIIEEVIEKNIKRKVCVENLFSQHQATSPVTRSILEPILNHQLDEFSHVVWTYNMRRLAVLIAKAFIFNEPVLLVGETGCGKTTICQVLAALRKRQLLCVNCHMHTESSDFLGGLRPVRQYNDDGRLFEWCDGPLIKAMESGDMFLADEISLADDSVLERLNSLLEPERQLVLSERGMEDNSDIVIITANKEFHFIGTMNPGGDFGKKELSPALRNRFTEIWCDSVTSRQDLLAVLERSVSRGLSLGNQEDGSSGIGNSILDFTDWIKKSEVTNKFPFSIRDLLSWVQFINVTVTKGLLDTAEAYVHGACMTFLDCFGTALTGHIESETLSLLRKTAIDFLLNQIKANGNEYTQSLREMLSSNQNKFAAELNSSGFGIKPFYIDVGMNDKVTEQEQKFTFVAPTTGTNTLRLLRGLQLNKAILLEGNPGVGKTSLVTALARSSGHKVVRINLSDQTDITDLFGTDLPTEDGSFTFKEGAFLSALQNGDWILLDELNLAPQPVLEGLNACLDHRGEVYIPELGKTFKVKKETRLFACQNPLKQGGARRGLPISFLNRFTQVYIDTLTKEDMIYIVESQYPSLPQDVLHKIVKFNCRVAHEISEIQSWAHKGGPWEMNLRDIQRWCEALVKDQNEGKQICPGKFVDMLYINRMRSLEDKDRMTQTYGEIFFPEHPRSNSSPMFSITDDRVSFGDVSLQRNVSKNFKNRRSTETDLQVLRHQLPTLRALAQSVKMNWLSILVGPSATGKSSIVQVLADLTGNELQIVPVTSAMDVSDLLGGFEQVDYNRKLEGLYDSIETVAIKILREIWVKAPTAQWKSNKLLSQLYQYKNIQATDSKTNDDVNRFREKIQFLIQQVKNLFGHTTDEILESNLKELMDELVNLQTRLSKSKTVNTGGKFEWIDALLVKSLIEGSWLLLDNVNLTSAAVLDRLNGLLEPNGVLSIPERGEFSEIRPHSNFRIFFTMDPKYGEISRAMRNRGVEIFLLRPEDLNVPVTETMPYLDLIALLSSCGLQSQYHDVVIKCHDLMSSFISGFEKPTISHLLQASHLTAQQVIRGIFHKTALLNSFSDIYIKPRCGNDFASNINSSLAEMKNLMLQSLEKLLHNYDFSNVEYIDTNRTLTVKGLSTDSANEVANQIASITSREVNNVERSELEILHSMFNIYTTYGSCPDDLLRQIHKIIQSSSCNRNNHSLKELLKNLNDKALTTVQKCSGNPNSYKMYFPETFNLDEKSRNIANSKNVLLYVELFKCVLSNVLAVSNFSALDYSKAVSAGNLTDDFVEYPLLKYCQNYLQIIDKHIEDALTLAHENVDDVNACKIIQLLNWRSRFVKICSLPIFVTSKTKRTPILKEDVVPLIYTHFKWLQKHLIGQLSKLLPENHTLLKSFDDTLKSILLHDTNDNKEILKLSKKLRKLYSQPKLYQDQSQYDLCVARTNIINKLTLDLNQPLQRQRLTLTIEPTILFNYTLALDVPESEILATIKESVSKALERNTALDHNVTLMPINSYILQRILNVLQPYFLSTLNAIAKNNTTNGIGHNFVDLLRSLVHYSLKTRTLVPALQNILQVIFLLEVGDPRMKAQRISSLPAKFWDEFYKTVINSPSNYPVPFLRAVSSIETEDLEEDVPINGRRLSANLPLLPYYVQKFVISTTADDRHVPAYETVSLKDREEYAIQLEMMRNILWSNITTLDAAASIKSKIDAEFEINKFEQLISYLSSIFGLEKDVVTAFTEHFGNKEVELIEIAVKSKGVYEDLTKAFSAKENIMMDKTVTKLLTAQLSLLTSLLFARVISEVAPVDHVEKYRLKIEYINEDVEMFNHLLSSYYMQGLVNGTISHNKNIKSSIEVTKENVSSKKEDLKKVHPHCGVILELKEKTAQRVHKYASGNTFRPKEPSYGTFVKDCKHFTKSVLASKTIRDLSMTLISTCNILYTSLKQNKRDKNAMLNARTVAKETTSWLYSVNAFYKKIDVAYSEVFPDLVKPMQSSLSQIVFSVTTLNDLMREIIAKINQGPILKDSVIDLVSYPNSIPASEVKEEYMNRFLSYNFTQLLRLNTHTSDEDTLAIDIERIKVLKMNLVELKMHSIAFDKDDKVLFTCVLSTLDSVVSAWEKQQRDIEKKKVDDEALYVTKSKCEDEDEDAVDQKEILELFPTYTDNDFHDFKPPTLEQKKERTDLHKSGPKLVIDHDDVSMVYKWHSDYIKDITTAEWLPAQKKSAGNDVVSPFLERYPIFSRVIENAWEALDADFEGQITPSLLVLLSEIKSKVDGDDSPGKLDFYKSPWVSETRQCVPLLQRVQHSVNELLDQWPDFPTLKDIIIIVNRILSFPVTSPISRFLTGLELLRDKIEEWNKNAHKGNNLIDVSLAVGQQIINWRKLEMGHWKECLNNLYQRKQSEAHKYWFYLYSVVNSYLNKEGKEEQISPQRVVTVLKDFMETSNLAEYEIRLDIVYTYHCHLVHFEPSQKRDELLSILWNTYNYYSQFVPQVTTQIKEKRAPIEKKLKDFVKICTWDRDLSYWSVKDTVEKAHKALHKHVKEFEKVIKESVRDILVSGGKHNGVTEHVGLWDRPKRATNAGGAYMCDVTHHVVLARNVKKYLDQSEQPSPLIHESSLLAKIPNLLNKAKALCKDTINSTGYPSLVQALDDFVTSVIETSTHLSGLEVDSTLPKDKQTSNAKNIVQQKRKALADLFKYLAKMGLNYRTGLVILSTENELYDFTIAPVDLDAAMGYLKSRRCDTSLSLLWSGCEQYFQKNIARHRFLTNALLTPHQDLGVPNIERCKGFAAQLMKITNSQKLSISKYSRHLCDLRTLTTNLTNALDIDSTDTNVSTIKDRLNILTECYAYLSIVLEQFKIVLKSCPEASIKRDEVPQFDIIIANSPLTSCYKNNEEWKTLYAKVNAILSNVNKNKTALNKLMKTMPKQIGKNLNDMPAVSQSHIDITKDAKSNLINVNREIEAILQEYQVEPKVILDSDFKPEHPILTSIINLSNYIKDVNVKLENLDAAIDELMEEEAVQEIVIRSEDLVATMLLIIQSVYKKHLPEDKSSDNLDVLNAIDEIIDGDSKDKKESKEILEDGHLKEHLQDKLSNDTRSLQVDVLLTKMRKFLSNYVQLLATGKDVEEVKKVAMRLVPILEQTVLFVQYFVMQKVAVHRVSCKMLSVLLNIFSDLATKGFCKPSDLDMEDGEGGEGPGKLSGGTGLGEGDGQKDVSERIENQDQLDDAHRPGEEKKDEERDCKEEEKGVNMTDDFDSHLQDVEKKEGEQSDNDDDEDDPDKQMGDIDNAAEKLDQQIWGSEDEEEPEEREGKKETEEKGKGESTGEKEMGAKDEETGKDDGNEGTDKKQKKDINEINEPEIDDDHVDPYHNNQPELPEEQDLDLPDNMNFDGNESGDEKEGETETENPFDIDVLKEKMQDEEKFDENDEGKPEENRNGLDVSDEEDEGEGEEEQDKNSEESERYPDDANAKENENQDPERNETNENAEKDPENPEQDPENPECPEPDADNPENPPQNPDKIDEEDAVEQKEHEANPQANPSNDDPSAEDKVENAEMQKGADDNVQTNEQQAKDEEAAPYEQAQEQVGEDRQSTGRSELDNSDKGHRGEKQAASRSDKTRQDKKKHENKPGRTDEERTLGEINKKARRTKTLNLEKQEESQEDSAEVDNDGDNEADAYEHVKQAKKDDLQAIDAATKEQAEQQPTIAREDQDAEEMKEDEEVPMDVDEDDIQVEKFEELKPEKTQSGQDKEKEKSGQKKEKGEENTGDAGVEVEGDVVQTMQVPRGNDTTYHTNIDSTPTRADSLTVQQYISIRDFLLAAPGQHCASEAWRALWRDCGGAARALCERLRLVLEPTANVRRAGDFRTGRAINMRRVIPYIASQFRKDRIWLRRTKPARREYKIAIAMDDSSSMADNRSKELAFESLAMVSQALNLLESGDLAVISFGEKPNLLHPFTEQFSEHSGSRILEQLRFDQTKTKIAQLLDFCTVLFEEQSVKSDALNAKLLVIVSDGRGIFSEGESKVLHAVRRARQQGIFLVYVIIDNPDNKDSIMDIRRPLLDPQTNALTGFVPYLDTFPFPYYLILRDMSALPTVLGDALRQWFELAANSSS